jgi:Sigma-54 interaction domain
MRPNLLLIGPDAVVGECLDRLITSVASPVQFCDGAAPTFTNVPIRSLIVRDVDRLNRADQERLIEWLNRHDEDARVIATSAHPIFPHVERGEFSDALYYRINTVTLVLSERPDVHWIGYALPSNHSGDGAPHSF